MGGAFETIKKRNHRHTPTSWVVSHMKSQFQTWGKCLFFWSEESKVEIFAHCTKYIWRKPNSVKHGGGSIILRDGCFSLKSCYHASFLSNKGSLHLLRRKWAGVNSQHGKAFSCCLQWTRGRKREHVRAQETKRAREKRFLWNLIKRCAANQCYNRLPRCALCRCLIKYFPEAHVYIHVKRWYCSSEERCWFHQHFKISL